MFKICLNIFENTFFPILMIHLCFNNRPNTTRTIIKKLIVADETKEKVTGG